MLCSDKRFLFSYTLCSTVPPVSPSSPGRPVTPVLPTDRARARAPDRAPDRAPSFCVLPAPEVPRWHAALFSECATVVAQFAHVPALRMAVQHRDELQRALDAAKVAVAQLPLSEDDYRTLPDRYAALVRRAGIHLESPLYYSRDVTDTLVSKLEELRALDVSALPQSCASDRVQPPAPPAPTTAVEGEDDTTTTASTGLPVLTRPLWPEHTRHWPSGDHCL
jgi:hypothetical protein